MSLKNISLEISKILEISKFPKKNRNLEILKTLEI